MEPISIGEILQAKGDADLAGGAGALLPASNAAQYIGEAAKARAGFNNYVSELHNKRLNDVVSDLKSLDYSNVLPEDLPEINKLYAQTLNDIGNNVDVISDPLTNPGKYQEFRKKLGNLQAMINTSKAHNAVYGENQKLLTIHPEYNTSENQEIMKGFTATPMADRRQFMLKTPTSFDPGVIAKAAMASTQQITDADKLSKNKHYILNEKGVYYDPDEYVQKYTALMNSTMNNGRTEMDNFRDMYHRLPADENGVKPSFDDVLKSTAIASLNRNTKITSMKPNEVALSSDRIAQSERESLRNYDIAKRRLDMDNKALKAGEIKPEDGAEAKALAMYDVLSGNTLNQEYGQNIYGSVGTDPSQVVTVQKGGDYAIGADGVVSTERTPVIKQIIPKVQFVNAVPNGKGGIKVTVNENSLDKVGNLVTKQVIKDESYDQMQASFNRIYGNKFTTQIASGTSAFNRKTLKNTRPQLEDLKKHFEATNGKPAAPTTKDNDPLGIF